MGLKPYCSAISAATTPSSSLGLINEVEKRPSDCEVKSFVTSFTTLLKSTSGIGSSESLETYAFN